MCHRTCTLAPLGVLTLRCLQGALVSPLPRSRGFHPMECTHLLEETHPLGHPPIHHTQGPLCQASPCLPLDTIPQDPILGSRQRPILGSRQCHLQGSSSRRQAIRDTRGLGMSLLLCPQSSLETEAPSWMHLASIPCEMLRSCGRP